MNQHRWTCLTTFILTAVVAPIATVRAAVTAPDPVIGADSGPSPQSLPTITPLTVTELETDAVIPATINQPVPLVSKLPIVAPLTPQQIPNQRRTATRLSKPLSKNLRPQLPIAIHSHRIDPLTTAIFNPNFQANAPIVVTSDPETTPVNAVVPLPSMTDRALKSPAVTAVASRTESTPILVVRSDRSQPTIVPNSTTAQAEIDAPQVPADRTATAITSSTAKLNDPIVPQPEAIAIPQVEPIVAGANNRAEIPSFEAGLPVFIFERERTQPRQIVATVIAQIGDDIVAPESSIAIPVQPPKQQSVPGLPVPTAKPADAQSVILDRSTNPSQPALTKIVATHTGQASWYGSEAGSKTANGESYNPSGMTAAHRTLPFGTKVRVTSIKTGKAVVVRINDRGPFHGRRMIDVSAGAAQAIGLKSSGVGAVRMEVLALGQ
ncbi:septal ring lytic transglycosylase RlpA family protein [Chamaesiphon sp.]|uniref:septal ring lytic transglycosylase RlpA family protein n=1 Tax=Chamaesiphon sp. TaxID=2814140 RepID=UPI0035934631